MKAAIIMVEGKLVISYEKLGDFLKERGIVFRDGHDDGWTNTSALTYLAIEFNHPDGINKAGLDKLVDEMFGGEIFNGGERDAEERYKILVRLNSGFGRDVDPSSEIRKDIKERCERYEKRVSETLGLKKGSYRREPETEALA